jgi:hypothetical protein
MNPQQQQQQPPYAYAPPPQQQQQQQQQQPYYGQPQGQQPYYGGQQQQPPQQHQQQQQPMPPNNNMFPATRQSQPQSQSNNAPSSVTTTATTTATNAVVPSRQRLMRPPFVDPVTNIIYDVDNPEYEGWLTKQSMWLKVRLRCLTLRCVIQYSYLLLYVFTVYCMLKHIIGFSTHSTYAPSKGIDSHPPTHS